MGITSARAHADASAYEFGTFHTGTLPGLLAAHGALAGADVAEVAPLTLSVEGSTFTYRPSPAGAGTTGSDMAGVTVEAGTALDTGVVVAMSPNAWVGFVTEMRSAFGLLYGGEIAAESGSLDLLIRWEPALRALYHGRPIYDPRSVTFIDRHGAPLDLHRSFTIDDDLADIAHFFHQTGFVHVRDVVTDDERARLASEVDRLRAEARPGDDRSWWATDREGRQVVCRLTYINERSETLAHVHEMESITGLVDALTPPGERLVVDLDRQEGHAVVIKNPDVVDGLSDLPWHVDCGLGGHPILCPSILVGVQLNAASEGAGQLHFLAGSHGHSCHQYSDRALASGDFPVVAVTTRPGDVTIHNGHALHVAPAPTGADAYRTTLYLSWHSALAREVIGVGESYNDVVLRSGADNVVLSVPEALARS